MTTVKLIYRTDKKNKNNEHPFYLRLIKNRRPKYISLGIYLAPEFWDQENKRIRKSYPNSQRLNNYIASKIAATQGTALEMESRDKNILPEKIKDQVMGNTPYPSGEVHIA